MLFEQSFQLQKYLNSEMGAGFPHKSTRVTNHPTNASSSLIPRGSTSSTTMTGISIRTTQFTGQVCEPQCRCNCHARHELRSPDLIEPVLGRLFVCYAGMPRVRGHCGDVRCRRRQAPCISIEYWFPLWFLAQVIMVLFVQQPGAGPHFQIRTIRRVPGSAKCITFAVNGNIEGMKALFVQELASPHDVSQTRNFSMLRVSCRAIHSYDGADME